MKAHRSWSGTERSNVLEETKTKNMSWIRDGGGAIGGVRPQAGDLELTFLTSSS